MNYVWIDKNNICAEMPSLIFISSEFVPMWKLKESTIYHNENDIVCIPKPKEIAIIRCGHGWGRNGNDIYYIYEPQDKIRKLIKYPTKKLYEKIWMLCLKDKILNKKWCFEWNNGKIVLSNVFNLK